MQQAGSAVEEPLPTETATWAAWQPQIAAWTRRFLGALICMALWLAIATMVLAFVLPGRLRPEDPEAASQLSDPSEARMVELGVDSNIPLRQLLGFWVTPLYLLSILPLLVMPMNEEGRFEWFLFAAYGWVFCLFGSVLGLRTAGVVEFTGLPFPVDSRAVQVIVACLFLVPALLSFAFAGTRDRASSLLLAMAVGWLIFDGGALLLLFVQGRLPGHFSGEGPLVGVERFGLLAGTSLYVIVMLCTLLIDDRKFRGELLGLLMLSWLLIVPGFMLVLLLTRAGVVSGSNTADQYNWGIFLSLVVTAVVGPVFSWLGAPWTKGNRLGWMICFGVAAFIVINRAMSWKFLADDGFLYHVWKEYDGPHLLSSFKIF